MTIQESPDKVVFPNKDDYLHWLAHIPNFSFIVDRGGDMVAAKNMSHAEIQTTLYLKHKWDESEHPYYSRGELESRYLRYYPMIKFYADDEQKLIDELSKDLSMVYDEDDEGFKNNVRKQLDKYAVGRFWVRTSVHDDFDKRICSFWNSYKQLTKDQERAIFNLMYDLGLDPMDYQYEFSNQFFSYTEFVTGKVEHAWDKKEAEALHTLSPEKKREALKATGAKPKTPYPLKYKQYIRQENFEKVYDMRTESKLKYYAFDWDDNLLYMPTEIYFKDAEGNKVGVGTSDFSKIKHHVKEGQSFEWDGKTLVGLHEESYINFRSVNDENFINESLLATTGPAWNDFVTAVNNGRIFAIITARGHSPEAIRESIENLIRNGKGGLNYYLCVENLRHMHDNSSSDSEYSDEELFERYLGKLCKYYPTTYTNPEGVGKCQFYKEKALHEFVDHVSLMFEGMDTEFRRRVSNNFVIGFSDDDSDNVNHICENFHPDKVEVYSTESGSVERVESRFERWKNGD